MEHFSILKSCLFVDPIAFEFFFLLSLLIELTDGNFQFSIFNFQFSIILLVCSECSLPYVKGLLATLK